MAASYDTFRQMKSFVDFNEEDSKNLTSLVPIVQNHGRGITDAFYDTLGRYPDTAAQIEGRVEHLKSTHGMWLLDMLNGSYEEEWFNRQLRIGLAHVRIGLAPYYVEVVMSLIRSKGLSAMEAEIADPAELHRRYQSLVKILDLLIINLAYSEELFDRLSKATGMRRTLIENLMRRPGDRR